MVNVKTVSVYETQTPQNYLQSRLENPVHAQRGIKSRFAQALDCDRAYVTRLLNGSAQLSLEQGLRANLFFGHTPDEADFFLAQIGWARAGTRELRAYYVQKMDLLRDHHRTLSKRIKNTENFPELTQATYYSLWLYAAVDIATSVPALQTVDALSEYFRVETQTLMPILTFLRDSGVVEQKEGKWINTNRQVYLPSDSPHIRKHHLNWRIKAIQLIEEVGRNNLHYSSVISVSKADFEKLKEHFIQSISEAREIVRSSKKDEQVCVYNIDCFELKI